jgi:alpha/beta superfamily hydrolase
MPEVIIPGQEGRIEGRYQHSNNKNAPIALILHPHPLYGGTMNNKVVYKLFQTYTDLGFSTLRFNFRGIGRSQGTYGDGLGELCDAATALDWLQQQNPDASSCWIAGFSFGAWIALQLLMRRPELEGFVAVSPPANLYDFTFLSPCPSSGLVTMGTKDDVVVEEEVRNMLSKLSMQPGARVTYQVIEAADHYYRNHLDQLGDMVRDYVNATNTEFKQKRRFKPDRKRRQLPRD